MTREELLRVLSFAGSLRKLSEEKTDLASVDARWNIVAYAMNRHFEGKMLTWHRSTHAGTLSHMR